MSPGFSWPLANPSEMSQEDAVSRAPLPVGRVTQSFLFPLRFLVSSCEMFIYEPLYAVYSKLVLLSEIFVVRCWFGFLGGRENKRRILPYNMN